MALDRSMVPDYSAPEICAQKKLKKVLSGGAVRVNALNFRLRFIFLCRKHGAVLLSLKEGTGVSFVSTPTQHSSMGETK
jgi:hypothetical protein